MSENKSDNEGFYFGVFTFLGLVLTGFLVWLGSGRPSFICWQPSATVENYVELKLEALNKKCLFIVHEDKSK